jgi:hypothetical protein
MLEKAAIHEEGCLLEMIWKENSHPTHEKPFFLGCCKRKEILLLD